MIGPLLAALAVGLVLGTALTFAATLRLPGLATIAVAVWVIGFAEVIGLLLFLSLFRAVTRPAIFVGLAALLAAAVGAWHVAGRPSLPPVPVGGLRALARVPVVLVLAVATGLALLYSLAIIVGTPPASHDSLTYHLTRAAFWSQDDRVGYIANAFDERMNAHPPNAEIGLTFLLEVGRHERLAGFVQFGAGLAIAMGVFVLGRRLNLARREAAFGALLFLMLPVVLLQTSTAQNDLVAASFLVAATVLLTGSSRAELALGALALALAVGTKVPAAYGVPILLAVALLAVPKALRVQRMLAVVGGTALGAYWYVVNLVRTGSPAGDLEGRREGVVALFDPDQSFFGAAARFIDAVDVSGARGLDLLFYPIVASVVSIGIVVIGRERSNRDAFLVLLTWMLIASPFFLVPAGRGLWELFLHAGGLAALEDNFLPPLDPPQTFASDTLSWYGPLGFAFALVMTIAVVPLVRRRTLAPLALVFATAPLTWLVLFSLSLAYDHTQGRFFMFPLALSAALWGIVLRLGRYAVAAVAVAATTAALCLVNFNEKPSGLRLIEPDRAGSVWRVERGSVQAIPDTRNLDAVKFLDALPDDASVAIALSFNDFGFPAFDPRLERRVVLVAKGSDARSIDAMWLLAGARRSQTIDRDCWRVVMTSEQFWTGFRRAESCRG